MLVALKPNPASLWFWSVLKIQLPPPGRLGELIDSDVQFTNWSLLYLHRVWIHLVPELEVKLEKHGLVQFFARSTNVENILCDFVSFIEEIRASSDIEPV